MAAFCPYNKQQLVLLGIGRALDNVTTLGHPAGIPRSILGMIKGVAGFSRVHKQLQVFSLVSSTSEPPVLDAPTTQPSALSYEVTLSTYRE